MKNASRLMLQCSISNARAIVAASKDSFVTGVGGISPAGDSSHWIRFWLGKSAEWPEVEVSSGDFAALVSSKQPRIIAMDFDRNDLFHLRPGPPTCSDGKRQSRCYGWLIRNGQVACGLLQFHFARAGNGGCREGAPDVDASSAAGIKPGPSFSNDVIQSHNRIHGRFSFLVRRSMLGRVVRQVLPKIDRNEPAQTISDSSTA
jgi:hypothetical protein